MGAQELDMTEVAKPPPPPRYLLGFPGDSVIKNVCQAGEVGLIPGSRRFPEKKMATHSNILALEIP